MFCSYCGKQIADHSVFCPNCGRELAPMPEEMQPLRQQQNGLAQRANDAVPERVVQNSLHPQTEPDPVQEAAPTTAMTPPRRRRKPLMGALLVAAALVVGLLGGFLLGRSIANKAARTPEAVETAPRESVQMEEITTLPTQRAEPATEPVPETTEPPLALDFRVALITDGEDIDDPNYYNKACWEGIVAFCEENGVDHAYYNPGESYLHEGLVATTEEAIDDGYDVIVLPGYLFGPVLVEVQEKYPEVKFIAVDVTADDLTVDYVTYSDPGKNAVCISFAEEQAGYLAGYAAVKAGYTKLGFLGGMPVNAVIRYGTGYVQGARDAAKELNVSVEMSYMYADQFYGDANITAQMDSWYQTGTEIVFACGGALYTSAVEAAERYNAKVIGLDVDLSGYNDCIVTSATKRLDNAVQYALVSLAESRESGDWACGGTCLRLDLQAGDYVGLPTQNGAWRLDGFTVEEYEALKAKLSSGEIAVADYFPQVIGTDMGDPGALATDYLSIYYTPSRLFS